MGEHEVHVVIPRDGPGAGVFDVEHRRVLPQLRVERIGIGTDVFGEWRVADVHRGSFRLSVAARRRLLRRTRPAPALREQAREPLKPTTDYTDFTDRDRAFFDLPLSVKSV